MAKKNSGYEVGIDLGTTYSCVAVWRHDRQEAEVIPNEQGNRITPSCVAFRNGHWVVGEPAANTTTNPANVIKDVKRLIGRKYNEPAIQDDLKKWPFKVIPDKKDNPVIVAIDNDGKEVRCKPEEISAMILKKMCKYAETYLQSPVKDVVITVPAYFNDSQRQATKEAASIAGLNAVQIINEPSAAALAYGVQKGLMCNAEERNLFIFDLGGGTFDVSLVNVKDGVYEVKAKAGNNHLGGEDFVNKMMTHLMEEFKRKKKVDMSGDPKALRKLRDACERAKRGLSREVVEVIEIDSLCQGIDFSSKMSRAKFEELNRKYFEECMKIVKSCLEDAKMEENRVHDVILVGGSSRIPKLKQMLRDFFKGKDLKSSINPDEAVGYGAAVQAGMLSQKITRNKPVMVLLDVTPLSLGVGAHGNIMSVLIPKNTPYPVKKERKFYTIANDQTNMFFNVYEGQRTKASANNFLGSIKLTGIPRNKPRGHPVRVCFEVDADGILRVSMEEEVAGKMEKKINKAILSNRDITKLIQEGKMYEAEDKEYVENAETINALDRCAYNMEEVLKDKKKSAKLSSQDKENMSRAIAKAKKLLADRKERKKTSVVKDCLHKTKTIYDAIKRNIG